LGFPSLPETSGAQKHQIFGTISVNFATWCHTGDVGYKNYFETSEIWRSCWLIGLWLTRYKICVIVILALKAKLVRPQQAQKKSTQMWHWCTNGNQYGCRSPKCKYGRRDRNPNGKSGIFDYSELEKAISRLLQQDRQRELAIRPPNLVVEMHIYVSGNMTDGI